MDLAKIYDEKKVVAMFTIYIHRFVGFQFQHEDDIIHQLRRLKFYERKVLFREVNSFEEMKMLSNHIEKISGTYSLIWGAAFSSWTYAVIAFRNNHIRIEFHVDTYDEDSKEGEDTIVSLVHVSMPLGMLYLNTGA